MECLHVGRMAFSLLSRRRDYSMEGIRCLAPEDGAYAFKVMSYRAGPCSQHGPLGLEIATPCTSAAQMSHSQSRKL